MGLWEPALYYAINARLSGDTGTGGLTTLLGNGANSIAASFPRPAVDPRGTTLPTVTFNTVDEENPDEPFDGRYIDHQLEVHVYVEEQPSGGGESLLVLSKIKERIMGDWPNQTAASGPSYGLDRWQPNFSGQTGDAATSYTANHLEFISGFDATDPGGGVREWIYRFKCRMFLRRS